MQSDSNNQRIYLGLMLAAGALEIAHLSPVSVLWTAPMILLAAMMIAWAAESAQFFIAQGFALAILAWLQTLPEFAVEAVLAWKQQVPLLLANLTGALRLLTGLGWPMIYFTSAFFYRRKYNKPMRTIHLDRNHCVEVMGLLPPLVYVSYICWKGTLGLWDAGILITIYVAYLVVLSRMPPEEAESLEDMERIPRAIVSSSRTMRNIWIAGLFVGGGLLIYYLAEPFLGSLLSLSAVLGVPNFVFVQWVAPFVSEFPEKVSAFYWARTIDKASMALMNMVSSNINQWTLLTAMLAIVYSWSVGAPAEIAFGGQQKVELLMTLGQSLVGWLFLVNMRLEWWEATSLFALWAIQFALSPLEGSVHYWVTVVYFAWAAFEIIRILISRRMPVAFKLFREVMR
jgi:cation:H+ antiporter